MRNLLVLLAIPAFLNFCNDSTPPPAPPPPKPKPTISDDTAQTVVRLDMGERFRGSAVVLTSTGYAVTALANLDEYEFFKFRVTIGSERIPGKIVAVDKTRGVALIKAERPLSRWAVVNTSDMPTETPVVVVGYVTADSHPPMITRQQLSGHIDETHMHGESVGYLDIRDMMTVSVETYPKGLSKSGGAVFDPKSGGFIGLVIGGTGSDSYTSSPLMTVPASVIKTFLAESGVRLAVSVQ